MPYDLIIFDLDGTLSPTDQPKLYDDAAEWLAHHEEKQIAIASNQGGVGLRHWQESGNFGEPQRWPTQETFQARLYALNLGQFPGMIAILRCYRYQSKKSGQWCPVPDGFDGANEWRMDWRKPAPGMLLEAMRLAQVEPGKTLMVGDRQEDHDAAMAAGCNFLWAWQFFGRSKPESEEE